MVGICLLAGVTQLVSASTAAQQYLRGTDKPSQELAIKADPNSLVQCRGPEYGGSSDSVLGLVRQTGLGMN